jgi:hypothetical protein
LVGTVLNYENVHGKPILMSGPDERSVAVGDDLPWPGPSLLIEKILIRRRAVECPDDELDPFKRRLLDEKGKVLEKLAPFRSVRHEHTLPG